MPTSYPYGWSRLRPYQQRAAQRLAAGDAAGLWIAPGLGKAQPLDCRVMTPHGWARLGDLRVGDAITDPVTGAEAHVVGVFPQGECAVYRLTTTAGATTLCTADHLWLVRTPYDRKIGRDGRVISTAEMLRRKLRVGDGGAECHRNFALPVSAPVELRSDMEPLLIPPYVLGVLLADGCLTKGATVCNPDEAIERQVERLLGHAVTHHAHANRCDTFSLGPEIAKALRDLALHGKRAAEKFVPEQYLRASTTARLELLRGLMDCDGDASNGRATYNTSSSTLRDQVVELVRSLGGLAAVYTKPAPRYSYLGERRTGQPAFRVDVRLRVCPFWLKRKATAWRPARLFHAVDKITPEGTAECACIATSAAHGLYLTDDGIVTHNTAAGLAAWALGSAGLPVLILTRAIGRHVWGRDAAWVLGADPSVAVLWGGKRYSKAGVHRDGTFTDLGAALEAAPIVVTNYEVVGRRAAELGRVPWRYLILDEAHAIKQGWQPPRRYESSRKIRKRRFEHVRDLARLVQARGGPVWELTATPVPDRIRDLWAQLHVVRPASTLPFYPPFGSEEKTWAETSFAGRYCALCRGFEDSLDSTGSSNLTELKRALEATFVIETRQTVATELPAITRDVRLVTPARSRSNMGGGIEEALARASTAKEPFAVDLALEYLCTGDKVVLVVNRRAACGRLAIALKEACEKGLPRSRREHLFLASVTGETEIRSRVGVTQDFQNHDGPAALVATMDSVTEAIDLHHASGLVFAALPYTPRQLEQLEGRVGRLGGVPCTVHYLVAEGTVDEQVRMLILSKLEAVTGAGAGTQGAEGAQAALSDLGDEEEILAGLRSWLGGGAA